MNNMIATYFFQEPENFRSDYANISGYKKNNIYWDTVFLFFLTSSHINKSVRHCFFTNVSVFPYRKELEDIGVTIYSNIHNTNLVEGKWASVKYFFDVVNYINNEPDFPSDAYYALFDTDCIAISPFDFESLTKDNYAYISGVEKNQEYNFHGRTLKELSIYYANIFSTQEMKITEKIGGEFYCFKKNKYNTILNSFNTILKSKYNNEIRTEEQILSMINSHSPFEKKIEHIKRVWTTIKIFNLKKSDFSKYNFLHLPSEKDYMTRLLLQKYHDSGYLCTEYYKDVLLYKPFLLRITKVKNKVFK